MEKMRAQSSLEFLYANSIGLIMLTLVLVLFVQSQSDASALSGEIEAKRQCDSIASQISSTAASGDGTVAPLFLPEANAWENYTVYVSASNRSVSISYGDGLAGCTFLTADVSNGSASEFYLTNQTIIRNVNGGVVIG